ncbi:winged helix-turn-helix transcriptional regulator [Deinococcus rufus]|uniref:Winged helix-turn-helix transcriptional regulator n=1 Tax=Deinococcus rufus TaxID=2136097 RepID=A0ABV7ZDJ1_9DEIO
MSERRSSAAQPGPLPHPADRRAVCARFHRAVELVGRRWSGAIVHLLLQGPARFSVLRTSLPDITDRMLSERLRELESAGIVLRAVSADAPVRVTYALTLQGQELAPALAELSAWAHRWLPESAGSTVPPAPKSAAMDRQASGLGPTPAEPP